MANFNIIQLLEFLTELEEKSDSKEAEKIAKKQGYKRISVISGVGVRDYYRKLGYSLKDSYMIKAL